MDWLSPLSGLVGAVLGAGATFLGSRQVMNKQLEADRNAREEAERTTVVAALSKSLTALLEQAARIPEDTVRYQKGHDSEAFERLRADEKAWDERWQPLIRAAKVAALEVRHEELRNLLTTGLEYLADWSRLEYAFHGKIRAWVLRGVVDHLVECVFAWRRGEDLPPARPAFTEVAEAWQLKREEFEARVQAEEEQRLRDTNT